MQGRGQVLGPGEGAIVYGDSIAWEDQGCTGSGAQGKGEERCGEPWGQRPKREGREAGGRGRCRGSPRKERREAWKRDEVEENRGPRRGRR